MRDVAYLTIPQEQVEALASTMLGLYSTRAEALGASAQAFLEGADELLELEHARGELRAIEDALADLGWPNSAPDDAVELAGPRLLLRDLMRTAVLDAANGVVEAVVRYEAGREELPAVRQAVTTVSALFDLFASFEADGFPAMGR